MTKNNYDNIANYAKNTIPHIDNMSEVLYTCDFINYNKSDIKVVYKIYKMLEEGIITKEKYYDLMELYYDYIDFLSLKSFAHMASFTSHIKEYGEYKEIETDLLDYLKKVEDQLDKYELLPKYVSDQYLLDSAVKLKFMKKDN